MPQRAFVAGPRWLTESPDLGGRVFQHSHEAQSDPQRAILGAILNAPVGVAHRINSQYCFATVDPQRFGAGDKSTDNMLGEVGVNAGASGDLRIRLPWQALAGRESQAGTAEALHEPLRLTVGPCAATEAIDRCSPTAPRWPSWPRTAGRRSSRWTPCGARPGSCARTSRGWPWPGPRRSPRTPGPDRTPRHPRSRPRPLPADAGPGPAGPSPVLAGARPDTAVHNRVPAGMVPPLGG